MVKVWREGRAKVCGEMVSPRGRCRGIFSDIHRQGLADHKVKDRTVYEWHGRKLFAPEKVISNPILIYL